MSGKTSPEVLEQKIMELEKKISEIEESGKKCRELMEYLPETIFELDTENNITIVNRKGFEVFGYTKEDFDRGLNAVNIITPNDRKRAAENIERIRGGEDLGLTDYLVTKKDGTTFPAMIHSIAVRNQDGPIGIRGFFADATDKMKIEAQARQSQRMEAIGVLAGGVGHDFNNILTIIIANIEIAMMNMPNGDQRRVRLENAIDASLRAKDLVSQLITFSRSKEKGRFLLKINLMVKESLNLLASITPKNVKITQNVRYESGKVLGDPVQINQLLMNLCMNSLQAMEENGGTLDVSLMNVELDEQTAFGYQLAKGGTYVNLRVTDTGVGIDPKIQDRIFEPYFTTKEKGKGSGLGLSVVYGIVKDYGGGIRVDSFPGKGTTVNIVFPVVEEAPKRQPPEESPDSKKRKTILFVDDEEIIIEVAHLVLENLGFDVKSTTSPANALELLKSAPDQVDLVITDASMPIMKGEELIRNILSICPNMPTIICTGNSGIISEQQARKLGISAFLRKPFKKADMMNAIQEALGA